MSKDYEYLSDQELNSLIESVEAEGLVNAPEDFMTEVLDNIVEIDKYRITAVPGPSNRNILDYSIYCLKVFGSIAAAILIMVMVPFIRGAERVPDRAEVVSQISVPSKEDVVSQKPVKSKEEVLNKQTQAPDFITDVETWLDSLPISK
jgi:hypothetical protein